MKIVYWGTYDLGKPRNRIILCGLRQNDIDVVECHRDLWAGIEDKSQIKGWWKKALFLGKWLFSYPCLVYRYLKISKHDVVVIGYLGHLDILVIWPFARIRGIPVVWDAFLSLYDTVVVDRCLVHRYNPLALILYLWEWLACRAADRIILDTRAHAEFFENLYGVDSQKFGVAFVGAESHFFLSPETSVPAVKNNMGPFTVLFYGQFIPLHGIDTIIRTARILEPKYVQFVIIGKGQEEEKIKGMLEKKPLHNVRWLPWVKYEELNSWVQQADACLGIFGDTPKAGRVIPNKVYQIVASGKPLITRDSPAIRELLSPDMPMVKLVTANDHNDLAEKISCLVDHTASYPLNYPDRVLNSIKSGNIGGQIKIVLEQAVSGV